MASRMKKTKAPASPAPLPIATDPEMAERFERELAWCVGQLECMLRSSSIKDKDPPRSAMQVLSNPKASLIRKRQMMQQLFGDYRQKMNDEDVARQKNMSVEHMFLANIIDQIVLLDENLSPNDLNAIRKFKAAISSSSTPSTSSLLQILPVSLQRQVNDYLNEVIGQLVLCTGVNVKSQLPSTISHIIKRTLANRKEITSRNTQFRKQINAINELYSKVNTQIQNVIIEQLKMVKANDLNTCQVDTLREQYQLLLKQIQLHRCELIRDIYTMDNLELLQNMKLDCEEKQQQYDEQIKRFRKIETAIGNEGVHYQHLIKHYYELCDELTNAQNALKRLKQQRENTLM